MQEGIPRKRHRVVKGFDEELFKTVAKKSGSKSVQEGVSILRITAHHTPEKMIAFSIDNIAILAGTIGKKHFRLTVIAVEEAFQNQGYGTLMFQVLTEMLKAREIDRITLRTQKNGKAQIYYQLKFNQNRWREAKRL